MQLQWRRPDETRPDLAASAVGRRDELDKLHRRLHAGGEAALLSIGATAAVRGQPGIGKTVLAAMYANQYGHEYGRGVLWLDVGPQARNADDAKTILRRAITYAYHSDIRVSWLDECIFEPEVIRMLLSGHGRLLIIIDDVWSEDVIETIKKAAPAGSALLLTTRDYRVAYALGERADAVQELDILSASDARKLLQVRAPGLDDDLADAVAEGLGYHAQALALAAAALNVHKAHRYEKTAAEMLKRVEAGHGFGGLPLEDKEDEVTKVEIALRFSFDYLGESSKEGDRRQACFRALGCFAQEADFDAEAAAALWDMDEGTAERLLLLFDNLALIQETKFGGRWQQHAILRSYALSILDGEERMIFPRALPITI